MDTYVLYILGNFDTHENILFYCSDVITSCPSVNKITYVMECSGSLVIIFESDTDESDMIDQLPEYVINDYVKFYFVHRLKDTMSSYIPPDLNDMIYKVQKINSEDTIFNEPKTDINSSFNLDDILDKIDLLGYDSLTENEKAYLKKLQ